MVATSQALRVWGVFGVLGAGCVGGEGAGADDDCNCDCGWCQQLKSCAKQRRNQAYTPKQHASRCHLSRLCPKLTEGGPTGTQPSGS